MDKIQIIKDMILNGCNEDHVNAITSAMSEVSAARPEMVTASAIVAASLIVGSLQVACKDAGLPSDDIIFEVIKSIAKDHATNISVKLGTEAADEAMRGVFGDFKADQKGH